MAKQNNDLRDQQEQAAKLREMTDLAPENIFDVLDEAACHIIEHFQIPDGKVFDNDYAVIFGKCYMGQEKANLAKKVQGQIVYFVGNVHEWSHDLAGIMQRNPILASYVIHAVEIYGRNTK